MASFFQRFCFKGRVLQHAVHKLSHGSNWMYSKSFKLIPGAALISAIAANEEYNKHPQGSHQGPDGTWRRVAARSSTTGFKIIDISNEEIGDEWIKSLEEIAKDEYGDFSSLGGNGACTNLLDYSYWSLQMLLNRNSNIINKTEQIEIKQVLKEYTNCVDIWMLFESIEWEQGGGNKSYEDVHDRTTKGIVIFGVNKNKREIYSFRLDQESEIKWWYLDPGL